jgi:hypothetical protein
MFVDTVGDDDSDVAQIESWCSDVENCHNRLV